MTLNTQLTGDKINLKKMPKTFKQAEELYSVINKNKNHLFPFADWEMNLNSSEDCYERIMSQHNKWNEGSAYTYGIYTSDIDNLIGVIFATHFSLTGKNAELGYWLDIDYTGKGIMQEAISLLEKELFNKGLVKIIIKADTQNDKSAQVAKKLGYTLEATLKKDQFIETFNELRDFNLFSKIKE